MRDISTKVNNGGQTAEGLFDASEVNAIAGELENAVLRSGQTLDSGNVLQIAQAIALNALKAQSFQAGGTGDAVQLSPVSGSNGIVLPTTYTPLTGARATWDMPGTNTGAVTVDIGPTGGPFLGAKALLQPDQTAFSGGELVTGSRVEAIYDAAASGGSGAWIATTWALVSSPLAPVGFLGGFDYRLGADANHEIVIGPGQARSLLASTTPENIINTVDRTIDIENAADRVDGSGIVSGGTYFLLVGRLASDGSFAAGFSQTIAQPAAWRSFRRVGVVLLNGTNIRGFVKSGPTHMWQDTVQDRTGAIAGTASYFTTVTVPTGLRVGVLGSHNVQRTGTQANIYGLITSPLVSNNSPSDTFYNIRVRSNTSTGGNAIDTNCFNGIVITEDATVRSHFTTDVSSAHEVHTEGFIDYALSSEA